MNPPSPTPRTDALNNALLESGATGERSAHALYKHAKVLERELSVSRAREKRLWERLLRTRRTLKKSHLIAGKSQFVVVQEIIEKLNTTLSETPSAPPNHE